MRRDTQRAALVGQTPVGGQTPQNLFSSRDKLPAEASVPLLARCACGPADPNSGGLLSSPEQHYLIATIPALLTVVL